jgi:hypothetical protein
MWGRRYESGHCPFPVKNPRKVLRGFKDFPFLRLFLFCSFGVLAIGVFLLARLLIIQPSDLLHEILLTPFPVLCLSICLFATHRYFVGFLSYVERLVERMKELPET